MSKRSKKVKCYKPKTKTAGGGRQFRDTMDNMPLEHKQQIVSTIYSIFKAAGNGLSPIGRSCHLIAMMGAAILKNSYGFKARVVSGNAIYCLDTPDQTITLALDDKSPQLPSQRSLIVVNSHSIVMVDTNETDGDGCWLVDFQSPFLNMIFDDYPFVPGLLWGQVDSDAVSELSFRQSETNTRLVNIQRGNLVVSDLITIATKWYAPPHKTMKEMTLADLSTRKPETNRASILRYIPYEIEDNLTTLIAKSPIRRTGGAKK